MSRKDPEPTKDQATDIDDDAVVELLEVVLLAPPSEREEIISSAGAANPDVSDAVRARLAALEALGLDEIVSPPSEAIPEAIGEYRILGVLGRGGMGAVFLAEQPSLDRQIALKVMRADGLFFADSRERFRREAGAIARLEHPGIVKVFEVGEEDGVPYFAMERIQGKTLSDVIGFLGQRRPDALSGRDLVDALDAEPVPLFELGWIEACCEIGRQVAAALAHAHDRGIVHRDVKPSNIALTRDGRVQLFDFGLARSEGIDRLTQTGGQLGTLQYMPPEQLRGERELDARSDVYALGVTLFELLTLHPPFEGDTRHAIEQQILDGTPAPIRSLNRRVPPELERVIGKALDTVPARRYESAAALGDELRRVIERKPVLARPAGPLLRLRRWAQRRPALAVAGVAAVGLFGVAPSVLLWREKAHTNELTAALNDANTSFEFLERLLFETDIYSSNNTELTVHELLRKGAEGLDQLGELEKSPELEARMRVGLGNALANHSDFALALPHAERAYEIERALGIQVVVNEVRPLHLVANCLSGLGRIDEAAERVQAALDEYGDEMESRHRGRMLYLVGTAQMNLGQSEAAEENLRAALEVYSPPEGDNAEANNAIRWALAGALIKQDRAAEALELLEPTFETAERIMSRDHPMYAESLTMSSLALARLDRVEEAVDAQRRATEIIDNFYGAHSFPRWRFHGDYALLLERAGRLPDAIRELEIAIEIGEEVMGAEDPRVDQARGVLRSYRERQSSSQ